MKKYLSLLLLSITICCTLGASTNDNSHSQKGCQTISDFDSVSDKELFVYHIFGIKEDYGGNYHYSFKSHCHSTKNHNVKIIINSVDGSVFQHVPIVLYSSTGDKKTYYTDKDGSINVPFDILIQYPNTRIDNIDINDTKYGSNRRLHYEEMNISLGKLSFFENNGTECFVDEITIIMRLQKPVTYFYDVRSKIELGNAEIAELKRDIISREKTSNLWEFVVVTPYVEI